MFFRWLWFRRKKRVYSTLPDKNETLSWSESICGMVEKRTFLHCWRPKYAVINRYGFFLIYKSKFCGRVYDLKRLKSCNVVHSQNKTTFKLAFQGGDKLTLRIRDETAVKWVAKIFATLTRDRVNQHCEMCSETPRLPRQLTILESDSSGQRSSLGSSNEDQQRSLVTENSYITAADNTTDLNSTLHDADLFEPSEEEIITSNLSSLSYMHTDTTNHPDEKRSLSIANYDEWKEVLNASNSLSRKPSNAAESVARSVATSSVMGTGSDDSRTIVGPHFDRGDFMGPPTPDHHLNSSDDTWTRPKSSLPYMDELRTKLAVISEGNYLKRKDKIFS